MHVVIVRRETSVYFWLLVDFPRYGTPPGFYPIWVEFPKKIKFAGIDAIIASRSQGGILRALFNAKSLRRKFMVRFKKIVKSCWLPHKLTD